MKTKNRVAAIIIVLIALAYLLYSTILPNYINSKTTTSKINNSLSYTETDSTTLHINSLKDKRVVDLGFEYIIDLSKLSDNNNLNIKSSIKLLKDNTKDFGFKLKAETIMHNLELISFSRKRDYNNIISCFNRHIGGYPYPDNEYIIDINLFHTSPTKGIISVSINNELIATKPIDFKEFTYSKYKLQIETSHLAYIKSFILTSEKSDSTTYNQNTLINNKTEVTPDYGSFTDNRDGKIYKTIKIADKTWMAENLDYNCKNSYYYNNSEENRVFGRLYTYDAAKNACPAGWHLPSDNEWKQLADFIRDNSNTTVIKYSNRYIGAERYLQSSRGWSFDKNGIDKFGFAALPSGKGLSKDFYISKGTECYWWTTTPGSYDEFSKRGQNYVWSIDAMAKPMYLRRLEIPKSYALSIRCIKD
ncbi:MAG: hypothetical protein N4A72_16985 [Bacteroidales bacterium]|nr:hypothetical protein [Bacteroidales bacterium]